MRLHHINISEDLKGAQTDPTLIKKCVICSQEPSLSPIKNKALPEREYSKCSNKKKLNCTFWQTFFFSVKVPVAYLCFILFTQAHTK